MDQLISLFVCINYSFVDLHNNELLENLRIRHCFHINMVKNIKNIFIMDLIAKILFGNFHVRKDLNLLSVHHDGIIFVDLLMIIIIIQMIMNQYFIIIDMIKIKMKWILIINSTII